MKRVALFCVMIFFLTSPTYSADDPMQRGMELYKKHHYEEAARMLHSYLSSVQPGKKSAMCLSLGMICFKNAELYRQLYQASLSVNLDYLKRLSAVKGKARSRFVKLYMGEAFLEAGNPRKAASCFREFIADKQISAKHKAIARVGLGLAHYREGKKQQALDLWSGIKTSAPEVLSELAAAYSTAGLTNRNPSVMCEKALTSVKKAGKEPSIRILKNVIGVYARTGLIKKGLDLVRHADMKGFSYEEVLVKNKTIRFYDFALLNNLSMFYGKASLGYLKEAAADPKVKDAAHYYLGEAHALFGNIDQSIKVTDSFLSSSRMPRRYKDKATVRQAANRYQKGHKTEAINFLNNLSRQKAAPDLLAEVLFTCSRLHCECPETVAKATALAESGEGKNLSSVNWALGTYYLWQKDYGKALFYMEAGRDKSNKNRIEQNDPLTLTSLAEAYYRTKKFSEALEIYFEMSKHFPALRQIQVAMQGVYSMEQKSAGDVKVF